MSIAVLVTFGLVFSRLSALLYSMPVFSSKGVPKHVAVLLALAVTMLISPTVPLSQGEFSIPFLLAAVAGEVALGMLLGLVLSAVFAGLSFACEVMAMQIGLAMATMFNPLQETTTGALGVLCSWLAGLVFLGLGLHLHTIEIVAESFASIPPGSLGMPVQGAPYIIDAVGMCIGLGVRLAAPILALVWLVNVFVAALAKLAPRMNVFFSVGLTINSVGGIALLAFSLPWIMAGHTAEMLQALRVVERMLESF